MRTSARSAPADSRIGDLQGNPRRSNLGEVEGALRSYARSTQIRERIERLAPSAANRLAMARTLISTGEAAQSSDGSSHAIDVFTHARGLLAAMLRDKPGDLELLASLGEAEGRLGGVLRQMGRLDDSLLQFEASLDAAERVAEIDPAGARALSIAHNEIVLTLVRLGRAREALPHCERSMEIRAAAVAADPGSARSQRDLALIHHRFADLLRATGDPEGALEHDRAALQTLAALWEADPADARSGYDLSVALEKLASSLRGVGREQEGLNAWRWSLEIRQALAEEHPENLLFAKAYCVALGALGEALRESGHNERARERYLASIEAVERCAHMDGPRLRPARAGRVVARAGRDGRGRTRAGPVAAGRCRRLVPGRHRHHGAHGGTGDRIRAIAGEPRRARRAADAVPAPRPARRGRVSDPRGAGSGSHTITAPAPEGRGDAPSVGLGRGGIAEGGAQGEHGVASGQAQVR